jgi:uncharacterized protein (TIGR02391 family)
METSLSHFERIARRSSLFETRRETPGVQVHPFDERNLHPKLPSKVRRLFDDGHYAESTFEAFKFLDRVIARLANLHLSGFKLMMDAFSEQSPKIRLTNCSNTTEKDEQKGYQFIFAGTVLAIRNPRGHEYGVIDSPDICLDHLSLASLLLRRVEQSGHL